MSEQKSYVNYFNEEACANCGCNSDNQTACCSKLSDAERNNMASNENWAYKLNAIKLELAAAKAEIERIKIHSCNGKVIESLESENKRLREFIAESVPCYCTSDFICGKHTALDGGKARCKHDVHGLDCFKCYPLDGGKA